MFSPIALAIFKRHVYSTSPKNKSRPLQKIMNMLAFSVLFLTSVANAIVYIPNDDEYLDEIQSGFFILHAKKKQYGNLYKRDEEDYFSSNLTFVQSLAFYIDIEIGSNNDTVTVLLDTGSSDFWVAGYEVCESEYYDENSTDYYDCSAFGYFDAENSTTFTSNGTVFGLSYGDGSVAYGTFGQDDVIISNLSVTGVNFAVANFSNTTSGVLGIGYEATESTDFMANYSKSYEYVNFPEKLVEDGIINKATYSLYLDEEGGAEILFGAVDHEKYAGTLYQFPIVALNSSDENQPITRIAITLNSIGITDGFDELVVGEGYVPAVLDSGTTTASFPEGIADTFALLLNITYDEDLGYYYSDNCSVFEETYFNYYFQGIQYTSPALSYFAELVDEDGDSEGCIFQIYITNDDFIVLGDSFLRDMYTVIDLEEDIAALAYANTTNSSVSDIEVILDVIPSATDPPSNKTFGLEDFLFTFYDLEPVTTSYTPNSATAFVSFDSAPATVTLTPSGYASSYYY